MLQRIIKQFLLFERGNIITMKKILLILTLLICFHGFGQDILEANDPEYIPIRQDHLSHAAAGAIIGGLSYAFYFELTQNKRKSLVYSIGTSLIAGFIYEGISTVIIDRDFEVEDAIFVMSGSLAIIIPMDIWMFNQGNKPLTSIPPKITPTRQQKRIMRMNQKVREKNLRDSINGKNN